MSEIKDIKPLKERKKTRFVYPDGTILYGEIVDEIKLDNRFIDENTTNKVYKNLVQRITFEGKREEFRFCYYYMNLNNEKPKWIFGQYALTLSKEGLKELINKMKEKGWI